MESVLTWRPLGSLLNKVSFRELSFSPIDSIVSFNFDCLLACWWTHFCIDPRNFVIDSSVFEPIGFAAELFVEMSLSRLGLSESLTCAWLLIAVCVCYGGSAILIRRSPLAWCVRSCLWSRPFSVPGFKRLQVFLLCYRTGDVRSRVVRHGGNLDKLNFASQNTRLAHFCRTRAQSHVIP